MNIYCKDYLTKQINLAYCHHEIYLRIFLFLKIDSCKNLHFDTVLLKEHENEWTKVSKWDEIFSERAR